MSKWTEIVKENKQKRQEEQTQLAKEQIAVQEVKQPKNKSRWSEIVEENKQKRQEEQTRQNAANVQQNTGEADTASVLPVRTSTGTSAPKTPVWKQEAEVNLERQKEEAKATKEKETQELRTKQNAQFQANTLPAFAQNTLEKYGVTPNTTEKELREIAKEKGYIVTYVPDNQGTYSVSVLPSKTAKKRKSAEEIKEDTKELKFLGQYVTLAEREKRAEKYSEKGNVEGILSSGISSFVEGLAPKRLIKAGDEMDTFATKGFTSSYDLGNDTFSTAAEISDKVKKAHPIASGVGSTAGNVIALVALGDAVGKATSSVEWIANAAPWVQSAINSGITFAIKDAADADGSVKEVADAAASGFIKGGAGGAFSGLVGDIGLKIITDKGLANKVLPEIIRNGVSSAAFAGGNIAATAALYPEGYKPSKEEIAKDITVAFLFGIVSGGINSIRTTQKSKENLDFLYKKMQSDFEYMKLANAQSGTDGKITLDGKQYAKDIITYADAMEKYLNGQGVTVKVPKEYYSQETGITPYVNVGDAQEYETITLGEGARFIGQDKYVQQMTVALHEIKNYASNYLNGTESVSAGVGPSSASGSNATTQAVVSTIARAQNEDVTGGIVYRTNDGGTAKVTEGIGDPIDIAGINVVPVTGNDDVKLIEPASGLVVGEGATKEEAKQALTDTVNRVSEEVVKQILENNRITEQEAQAVETVQEEAPMPEQEPADAETASSEQEKTESAILPAEQNVQESAPAEPAPPVSKPTLTEKQSKAAVGFFTSKKDQTLITYGEYNGDSYLVKSGAVFKVDADTVEKIDNAFGKGKTTNISVSDSPAPVEDFFKEYFSADSVVLADFTNVNPYNYDKYKKRGIEAVMYVDGKLGFVFGRLNAMLITRASDTVKLVSDGRLNHTVLAGYDADGNLLGFTTGYNFMSDLVPFGNDTIIRIGDPEDVEALYKKTTGHNVRKTPKKVIPEDVQSLIDKYAGKEYSDGEKTYRVIYNERMNRFGFPEVLEDGSLSRGYDLADPTEEAINDQIDRWEMRKSDYEKRKAEEAEEAERQAQEKAKKDEAEKYMNAYLEGKTALQASKIRNFLITAVTTNEYGRTTKYRFVENKVRDGKNFKEEYYSGKMRYYVQAEQKNSTYEISKTEYDYGRWLENSGILSENANPKDLQSEAKDDIMESEKLEETASVNEKPVEKGKEKSDGSDILERQDGDHAEGRKTGAVPVTPESRDAGRPSDVDDTDLDDTVRNEQRLAERGVPGAETVRNGESDATADQHGVSSERVGSERHDGERVRHDTDDGSVQAEGRDEVAQESEEEKLEQKTTRYELSPDVDSISPSLEGNLKALELLHELNESGKKPTAEQKSILASFKGWGNVSDILYDDTYWNKDTVAKVNRVKELLGDKAFGEARSSVNNAYYTPTYIVDGVYKALKQLGVTGGNMLEPSCGVGNFFGRMPKSLYAASNLYGTELDSTTANIASLLYDKAQITNGGFQFSKYANDSFDYVVGNVPFDNVVRLEYNGTKYALHDYFFLKSLDLTKPGGIVAMLTSTGTLDVTDSKARYAMSHKADLVAAFRFSAGTFGKSAGTDVVTDLLIFKKREANTPYAGEDFITSVSVDLEPYDNVNRYVYGVSRAKGEKGRLNEYFLKHPDNVLGTIGVKKNQYGKFALTVNPVERKEFDARYTEAIKRLPKNIAGVASSPVQNVMEQETQDAIHADESGALVRKTQKGTFTKLSAAETVKYGKYLELASAYNELVNRSVANAPESELIPLRKRLGVMYDAFVREKGSLGRSEKENRLDSPSSQSLLSNEPDYWKIRGIELYDKKENKYIKSPIFNRNIFARKHIESATSAPDALAASLSEKGKIDLPFMEKITGRKADALLADLEDRVIVTPSGNYELTDMYLSGNIYNKLDDAKEAAKSDGRFKKNVELLEHAIPTPYTAKEIHPLLGASWIGEDYTGRFLKDLTGLSRTPSLTFDKVNGKWYVEQLWGGDRFKVTSQYGTNRLDAFDLFEKIINQETIRVTDKVDDTTVVNEEETKLAQAKADSIREAFEDWIFADEKRTAELTDRFNRAFNAYRAPDFDALAKALTLDGIDPNFDPRGYQKTAVARVIFGGSTLLAHGVGTGKTAESIMTAMEAKRIGLANRIMFVVPNNKPTDFRNEILKMYPDAKIVMMATENMPASGRQEFLGRVASSDFDIAIMTHSSFGFIPPSTKSQVEYINGRKAALEAEEKAAREYSGKPETKRFLRDLQKKLDALEARLKEILEKGKDDGICFDDLGIDMLVVDEAHNFKNLAVNSHLNISGVNTKDNSNRAQDMDMKLSILRKNDSRILFLTATPITRSMSEIFTMMQYVRPDILQEAGISSFDAFAKNFCKVEKTLKVDADGKSFKETDALRFVNVNQMTGLFREMTDVKRTEDVIKDLPEASYEKVTSKNTGDLKKYYDRFYKKLLENLNEPGKDKLSKMLTASQDLKASAIDLRLVADMLGVSDDNVSSLDFEGSKINNAVKNIVDIYNETSDSKGTQIVFLDMGVGDGTAKKYRFNLYGDLIEKLVKNGIPRKQIANIREYKPGEDLDTLYAKINNGEIRVLIGSHQKMSEGLNVQERMVAAHHINPDYNPSTLEQSNGRIIRHGNTNKNVRIFNYIQEGSGDGLIWDKVKTKAEFIRQAMSGGAVDEIDDIGAVEFSYAESLSVALGNPEIKEKADLKIKLTKLKAKRRSHEMMIRAAKSDIVTLPEKIEHTENVINGFQKDIDTLGEKPEKFVIELGGKKYDNHNRAGEALASIVNAKGFKSGTKIGSYRGIDLYVEAGASGRSIVMKGAAEHRFDFNPTMSGTITQIERQAEKAYPLKLEANKTELKNLKNALASAKANVNAVFQGEEEIKQIENRIAEIDEHLKAQKINDNALRDDDGNGTDTGAQASLNVPADDPSVRWTAERNPIGKTKDKKDAVRISRITSEISKRFGIPIETGKVTVRDASGIYKNQPETVRLRMSNDLPTTAHELGHHLDKKYDLRSLPSVKLLKDAVSKEFLDNYDKKQHDRESVAEFVRVYLKNTKEARQMCPEFYDDFLAKLSEEDRKNLDVIANKTNEYFAQDLSERYDAAIVSQKKQKMSPQDAARKAFKNIVDPYLAIKEATDYVKAVKGENLAGAQDAYILATNSLAAKNIANNLMVGKGFYDLNGNKVEDGLSFTEAIQDINSKDYDDFAKYLVLNRADYIADPRNGGAPRIVFGDQVLQNPENIRAERDKLASEHPEFVEAAGKVYQYLDNLMRHWVIPSGLLSEDAYNKIKANDPNYVPFLRLLTKTMQGTGSKSFANQKSPLKRMKGSGREIINPIESIILNTEKLVKASLKNRTYNVLCQYADTVDGFGNIMESIPPDMVPHAIDLTELKEKFNKQLQGMVRSADEFFDISNLLDETIDNIVTSFTPTANAGKQIVTVMRNGSPAYYQIHDKLFYDTVAEFTPAELDRALNVLRSTTNVMKTLITQNNPFFGVANMIRDINTAYTSSPINNPAVFFGYYFKAMKNVFEGSELYRQYKAMGGGHSSELSASMDVVKRTMHRLAVKDAGLARRFVDATFCHPVELVASFNDAIETFPRFAEFIRTLDTGGDLQEAAYNAAEITVNFNRSGSGKGTKIANAGLLFNNANIQGLHHMAKLFTDRDKKGKFRLLAKLLVSSVLLTAIQAFWNNRNDPEGYKNLSSYKKNNFFVFSTGDGKFITIPKARELSILNSLTERTIDFAFGKDKNAFYDFGGYLLQNLLPPMVPDSVKPTEWLHRWLGSSVAGGVSDIAFNKDFKGTPIESEYEKKYTKSRDRFNDSTTKLAYDIGQTKLAQRFDLSPKKIDHLISSYTGVLGQINKALFPLSKENRDFSMGLRNKFVSDSNYSTDVLNRCYDNLDKAQKQFEIDATIENAVELERNEILCSYISNMNKAIKALPYDQQRDGRKKMLKTLNGWQTETTGQQALIDRFRGDEVTTKYILDDLPSSTVTWQKDNVKHSYQMTPDEYDEYISEYLRLANNYRVKLSKEGASDEEYIEALRTMNGAILKTEKMQKFKEDFQQKEQRTTS